MQDGGVNLRELVLEALLAVTRDREYSHIVIRNILDKYQYLDKQERSFFKRVCQGTLEHMIWIDYVLNQFSNVKVNKMKPLIRCILRSSVYELKYMDAVPVSATCNEAVKLAGKKGFHNLKGFVNGVLRTVSRNLNQITLPDRNQDILKYLSVTYSMPEWILQLWKEAYSWEQMEEVLQSFLADAPVSIRVNPLKTTREELKKELQKQQIEVWEHPQLPGVLYLKNYDSPGRIPAFSQGKFYIQDVSSMQVAIAANPRPGDYVLDVCAAPGGKSIHMAELLLEAQKRQGGDLQGIVEARDLTEYKVSLIQENIERCGLPNIRAVQADARILDKEQTGKADIVIADLPCSGLGVLGRKADIKYRITREDIRELCRLQRDILHTVQQYVRQGGILMYSTCTINPAENEENVSWFLREHPEFQLQTQQQILPGRDRNDGFFLAKLRKESKI
ncbi:MAG: 16S rRNA (cytosine(967)-C(5))-methyltransferase RsmB [Lachnospiraceae bacterium]|nr:16S rRNA (cytosine(967)-C(5))-methyltransferase RsmB [Lachnospiraceae bacterium]